MNTPTLPKELDIVITTQPTRDEMFSELGGLIQSHNQHWEVYKLYLQQYRNKIHDFVTNMCISVIYEASCRNKQQQLGLELNGGIPSPMYSLHQSQLEQVDEDFRVFYAHSVVGQWQNGVNTPIQNYDKHEYKEMADAVIFNVKQTFLRDLQTAAGPEFPCLENFVGVKRLSDAHNSDVVMRIKMGVDWKNTKGFF